MKGPDDFIVRRCISGGSFSCNFEVELKQGKDKGTRFTLIRTVLVDAVAIRQIIREVKVLAHIARNLPNPGHLPLLYYAFVTGGSPIFVTGLVSEFTLADVIKNKFAFNENEIVLYAAELVCGLKHLHSLGIVHLNLNESNILFSPKGHLVISDFTRSIDSGCTLSSDALDFAAKARYCAPEVRESGYLSPKADIYAFGCVIEKLVMLSSFRDRIPQCFKELLDQSKCIPHENRPTPTQLTDLIVFFNIVWDYVEQCRYTAPLPIEVIPEPCPPDLNRLRRILGHASPSSSTAAEDETVLHNCAFGRITDQTELSCYFHLSDNGTVMTAMPEGNTHADTGFEGFSFENPFHQLEDAQTLDSSSGSKGGPSQTT